MLAFDRANRPTSRSRSVLQQRSETKKMKMSERTKEGAVGLARLASSGRELPTKRQNCPAFDSETVRLICNQYGTGFELS